MITQILPVFKNNGHDVRVSVKRDAVDRQRRQQREVPRPPRHLADALIRLVVAVVAASQGVARVIQYEEALCESLDSRNEKKTLRLCTYVLTILHQSPTSVHPKLVWKILL